MSLTAITGPKCSFLSDCQRFLKTFTKVTSPLGSYVVRHAGSSPVARTTKNSRFCILKVAKTAVFSFLLVDTPELLIYKRAILWYKEC